MTVRYLSLLKVMPSTFRIENGWAVIKGEFISYRVVASWEAEGLIRIKDGVAEVTERGRKAIEDDKLSLR